MRAMTRIESVEKSASGSYVAVVTGGQKVGTKDEALGEKLLGIFQSDPEHCMVDLEFEKRGERLFMLDVANVVAPEELGGPVSSDGADTAPEAAEAAPDPAVSSDSPEKGSAPVKTLDDLLTLDERVSRIEEHLGLS